jgi:transcriptional regulator with XRE-family HTH domain
MDPGEQLRERRLKLGLTQIALAEAVGCDDSSISKYEAGERTPTLRIALQLEQAIGVKASCWVAVA